jgi:hypothetical protein
LEGKSGRGRIKVDPDEAECVSRLGCVECVCKKLKKKKKKKKKKKRSCGQNRMDISLCREESQGQTEKAVELKKKRKKICMILLA